MKLTHRVLSLNNVVSYTLDLADGDELLEIIDDTTDQFRRVLIRNGYYTTGPMIFRAFPDSREFTIMTTLGNQVNLTGAGGTGFEFREHIEIETDYFHRHCDIEDAVPYAELDKAVSEAALRVQSIYHVILDVYGEIILDLYVETQNR